MLNLLSKSEQRRLEFVKILSTKDDWMTLRELAQILSCSNRTLKDDITYLKENFEDFELQTSSQGVRLVFQQDKGLRSLYQIFLANSIAFQFLELVFLEEYQSLSELADVMLLSTSTLYRLTEQINEELARFEMQIQSNPLQVVGNEARVRYFYYHYFSEKYTRLQWPFESIDEQIIDNLLMFFIKLAEINTDFADYNVFKLVSTVNLIRLQHQHLIHMDDIKANFDENVLRLSNFTEVFKDLEKVLGVRFDNVFIYQVFTPYIQEGFSLSYERLQKKVQKNQMLKKQITYLDKLLEELSMKNEIALTNKEDVLLAINNKIHLEYQEPQSGYILYNRNEAFAKIIKADFPEFYAQLYEAMENYLQFIDKPTATDNVNFYIYTLFINWENLVPELRKKYSPIRVLIMSDRHISHAYLLKDFIKHEFSEQITIEIYSNLELNQTTLESLNYDVIVSNFQLPHLTTKESVYIENVPTHNDIIKLQNVFEKIVGNQHKQ